MTVLTFLVVPLNHRLVFSTEFYSSVAIAVVAVVLVGIYVVCVMYIRLCVYVCLFLLDLTLCSVILTVLRNMYKALFGTFVGIFFRMRAH